MNDIVMPFQRSQIKCQLQDLGEMVSDKEMIFVILNAFTDEKGNLISNKEDEAIPFIKLWCLWNPKEYRFNKESDTRSDKRDKSMKKRK